MSLTYFFAPKMTPRQKMTRWLSMVVASALAGTASVAGYHLLFAAPQVANELDQVPNAFPAPWSDSTPAVSQGPADSGEADLLTVAVAPLRSLRPRQVSTKFTGIVTAARVSQLSAKQLGRVEKVHVDIGDKVAAGSVLVELDTDSLKAERSVLEANLAAADALLQELKLGPRPQEIAQAKTRVDEAEANLKYREAMLKRFEQLKRSNTVSQQEYDEAYTAYIVAVAQLESQRKSLELSLEGTRQEQILAQDAAVAGLKAQIAKVDISLNEQRIVAPFAGRVQRRMIDEGTVVNPGTAILEMVEDDEKEIRVGVPAELASQLADVDIRFTLGGESVAGEILRSAPAIDDRTRKIEVVLRPRVEPASDDVVSTNFETPAKFKRTACSDWLIGSAVTVEVFEEGIEDGLWVPAQCLTSGTRGLWSIYLAVPIETEPSSDVALVQRCEVEVLQHSGDWVEIAGPIQGDESVVIQGTHRLTPGQTVRVKEQALSVPSISVDE